MASPVVTGRQRPHEVLLLVVSLITGVAYLCGSPPPGSIAALMPRWEVHAWAVGLAVSGAVGLLGCFWRPGSERALWLELGAMLMGCGALLFYVVSVFQFGGRRALLVGAITAAWMVANLIRAAQIRLVLRGRGWTR